MGKLIYSVIASLDGNNLPVVCAQIVSKNHQEYQNISNNIELYRNPRTLNKGHCRRALTSEGTYVLIGHDNFGA